MRPHDHSQNSRIATGLIFILVGGLFLLNTLNIIDLNVAHIIFSFPFILFAIGILIMFSSSRKGFGAILTVIGAIFLLPRIFPSIYINGSIVWPVLIICIGLFILFRRRERPGRFHSINSTEVNNDILEDVNIFGGGEKYVNSKNFKGGSITAIFGGAEIDLTNCELAEGQQVIDILTIFGGVNFIVPKDWIVNVSVTPIMGGFSNKTKYNYEQPMDQTRTLVIKGLALLGGGEVKAR